MRPEPDFARCSSRFWAHVRTISERGGYVQRGTGDVKAYSLDEMKDVLRKAELNASQLATPRGRRTPLAGELEAYFRYRADALNLQVRARLMDERQAREEFGRLKRELRPTCPLPMNKQKGKKRKPAYLTGIVNMLVEAHSAGQQADFDPKALATVTADRAPVYTLSRRFDGCFPSVIDPVAVWETKEYYHTTTFGSRVADGIYETLLDGFELEDLRETEGARIGHHLMVDGRYTWWECGRSYLCRIVDMLNMGYVNEVLFGSEVLERLPSLVAEWATELRVRQHAHGGT
jgi:hypothetical protein